MKRAALGTIAATVLAFAINCGGGGGSSPSPSPTPSPTPTPSQNPCSTVSDLADLSGRAGDIPRTPADKTRIDGTTRWRVLDEIYAHRAAVARGQASDIAPSAATAANTDIGDIAVIQDQGDLILKANPFNLAGVGLQFTRNGAGGYDVRRTDATFRPTLGTRLTLSDDDSRAETVPFAFTYYGKAETAAFVNSDGNITFGEGDKSSSERNVSRLLTGPPRVAPFLADLDPSTGGSVWVNAAADRFTVTWCGVKGFESSNVATVQATLLPDGGVEIKIDGTTNLPAAVVGLSPGHTGDFTPVNLSAQGPTGGGAAAVGERFSDKSDLDTVAVARRFYATHADAFDQLLTWTDTSVLAGSGTFAYESTVKNEIAGIGVDQYDIASEYGSAGTLRSIVVFDALTKYPDDPTAKILRLGENNTLSLMGQEVGHRWLAFLEFKDHNGQRSQALLGRDKAHWSFFMNSDASVMEGNAILDLGGGSFKTVDAVKRYSMLDQYAMGLVGEGDVAPFFYVESPFDTIKSPEDAPQIGIAFNGTRRNVLIQDVTAVLGARQPSAANSARVHRQAFIYVITTPTPDSGQVAKLDRIRQAWGPFFNQATSARMTAVTTLRGGP